MGFLLNLLSPRVLLGIGLAVVAGLVFWYVYHLGAKHEAITWEAKFATREAAYNLEVAKAATAAASASEAYRAKEQAWAASAVEIQTEGEVKRAEIQKRAADLSRTVGGLRGSLTAALNAIHSLPSEAPAVTSGCAPAREAADLLGRMSIGLSEAGAVISRHADEAYAAELACVSADKVDR